jgi:cyclohexadieny/prephenate dehydrogenase
LGEGGRARVTSTRWSRLTVVSPGLIGGSIARAVRARRLADEVVVVARHEAAVRAVLDAGAAHAGTTDLARGVAGAEVVVLCAPVGALPGLVRTAWPHLASGAVLTDAGSVKRGVVAAARACPARAGVSFVGGHPMAGSERSGFEASTADLFEGRVALVTPEPATPERAVETVTALWERLGSTVRRLTAEAHDQLVAQISHLPHLAAYGLVSAADGEALPLAGRGFIDTTRIAASAETLWTDIFRENRASLLDALGRYEAVLSRWRELLARSDWAALEAELGRAREVREKLS